MVIVFRHSKAAFRSQLAASSACLLPPARLTGVICVEWAPLGTFQGNHVQSFPSWLWAAPGCSPVTEQSLELVGVVGVGRGSRKAWETQRLTLFPSNQSKRFVLCQQECSDLCTPPMPVTTIINHIFAGGTYSQLIMALHPGSPQAGMFPILNPPKYD